MIDNPKKMPCIICGKKTAIYDAELCNKCMNDFMKLNEQNKTKCKTNKIQNG